MPCFAANHCPAARIRRCLAPSFDRWIPRAFGCIASVCLLGAVVAGCGTTRSSDTSRSGLEQLLISTAVDQAVAGVDFAPFAGRAVYLDDKNLDCVDKKYVSGSLRRAAFRAGARVVDKREDAELVLEVHAGAVGTDRMEQFLGVPGFTAPPPVSFEVPDVKIASRTKQSGTVKLSLIAYDPETGLAAGPGGLAVARSDDSNWYVLGVGPFNSGTAQQEVRSLAKELGTTEVRKLALLDSAPADPVAAGDSWNPWNAASPVSQAEASDGTAYAAADQGQGAADSAPESQYAPDVPRWESALRRWFWLPPFRR